MPHQRCKGGAGGAQAPAAGAQCHGHCGGLQSVLYKITTQHSQDKKLAGHWQARKPRTLHYCVSQGVKDRGPL